MSRPEPPEIPNRVKHYIELTGGFLEPEWAEIEAILNRSRRAVWKRAKEIKDVCGIVA